MKTSNIIITSFFIFLFSGIILLYIGSKYYKSYVDPSNFAMQQKTLSPFSVVVAEPGAIFNLTNGKENKIVQNYLKGTVPNIASYVVRNDTLFISTQYKKGEIRHTKNVAEIFYINMKSIVVKENSDILIQGFQEDTLNIAIKKSRLNCREFKKVDLISVEATDSDIFFEGKNIENVVVKLDKAHLDITSKENIKSISGNIKNSSTLDCSGSAKVNLEADKTSKMYFTN